MESTQTEHPTCAILAADVVGYSRLMAADERGTHARLTRLRLTELVPRITAYRGRLVKTTGDGFLATFDDARSAISCATEIQRAITVAEAGETQDRRISLRMGLNVGEIIVEENDIYGDAVNVAARLQTYAEPGGIAVTGRVAEQIGTDPMIRAVDLGDLYLHNMARPVRMFTLHVEGTEARLVGDSQLGADGRPSIAVLPFRKDQTDPEETYFADGIVDDIIYALAGLKELFVISRGSTLGYGGADVDMRAIGHALGVRYVLYGSVRRAAGRLRIATELSDTETGAIIWSDKYDGELGDLFALQDRISAAVVSTIAPHVLERELQRALRKHPQNMTAYDLMLQALDQMYRMDDESHARARGLLQQAMAHDPFYALPYSYGAFWYVFHVGEGRSTNVEADAREAARLAETAIRLNENDPLALAVYGHVQSFLLHDYQRAVQFLDRAIEAGPSSAMAWTMSSATCGYIGNGKLAVERGERGVRLAPQDAYRFWHEALLGQAHHVNGNYEEAAIWARRAVGRNGAVAFSLRTLINCLMALNKTDEALAAARHLMRVQPGFRVSRYEKLCPFQGDALVVWLARLRAAGLPE
jgi:TolB-like protein/class 3 adenylate cyclase